MASVVLGFDSSSVQNYSAKADGSPANHVGDDISPALAGVDLRRCDCRQQDQAYSADEVFSAAERDKRVRLLPKARTEVIRCSA